jgi:hypothetical protein
METTQINFKQERDFGEIFNATFGFIGQEIKLLGKAILYFVLPILLIAAVLGVLAGIEQQKAMNLISSGNTADITNPFSMFSGMFKYYGIVILLYMVGMTSLSCTIYGYIKLYTKKGKDQFTLDDVWAEIKRYFFPILGISIPVTVIIIFGTFLCVIPGIYLGVSLCLIYIIYIYEEIGFSDAFSRSFNLTGQKWWLTFGIILIAYLMVSMISLILSVPSILLGLKPLFTAFKNPEDPMKFNFSTAYYIMNSLTSLIGYLLYSILLIVISFQYFSLRELKEKPSLQEKIDQIG